MAAANMAQLVQEAAGLKDEILRRRGGDFGLALLKPNAERGVINKARPQHEIHLSRQADGSVVHTATMGQTKTFTAKIPLGFVFKKALVSKDDGAFWLGVRFKIAEYDSLITQEGVLVEAPGPLDLFFNDGTIESALAPFVEDDGETNVELTASVTFYCRKDVTNFTCGGLTLIGTNTSDFCKLRNKLKPSARGPLSVLGAMRDQKISGKSLVSTFVDTHARGLSDMLTSLRGKG